MARADNSRLQKVSNGFWEGVLEIIAAGGATDGHDDARDWHTAHSHDSSSIVEVDTYSDGTVVTTYGDGTVTGVSSDGTTVTVAPDGSVMTTYADGSSYFVDANGNTTTTGTLAEGAPDSGMLASNGATDAAPVGGTGRTYADGTRETVTKNADGTMTVDSYAPDGRHTTTVWYWDENGVLRIQPSSSSSTPSGSGRSAVRAPASAATPTPDESTGASSAATPPAPTTTPPPAPPVEESSQPSVQATLVSRKIAEARGAFRAASFLFEAMFDPPAIADDVTNLLGLGRPGAALKAAAANLAGRGVSFEVNRLYPGQPGIAGFTNHALGLPSTPEEDAAFNDRYASHEMFSFHDLPGIGGLLPETRYDSGIFQTQAIQQLPLVLGMAGGEAFGGGGGAIDADRGGLSIIENPKAEEFGGSGGGGHGGSGIENDPDYQNRFDGPQGQGEREVGVDVHANDDPFGNSGGAKGAKPQRELRGKFNKGADAQRQLEELTQARNRPGGRAKINSMRRSEDALDHVNDRIRSADDAKLHYDDVTPLPEDPEDE